jgi:CheY-like chemotaxis protein
MQYDEPETPYSILIAGRGADFRQTIAASFRDNVYRVVFAADGKEAFDQAKSQHFDLVITGITMSKLDGIELLTALRQLDSNRPVIMVAEGTGEIENVYLRCAALLGAARTFQHPIDPLTFYRNARAVMLQSRLRVLNKV